MQSAMLKSVKRLIRSGWRIIKFTIRLNKNSVESNYKNTMSELLQLEKLQKTVRKIKEIKVIEMPTDFRDEARKTSREQIYIAGQMNMLVRVGEIIKEANL